jgi:hypothetical protein
MYYSINTIAEDLDLDVSAFWIVFLEKGARILEEYFSATLNFLECESEHSGTSPAIK